MYYFNVARPKCIITANERVVSANTIKPLKENVDKAMEDTKVKELVKYVFWAHRTDKIVAEKPHDVDLDKVYNHSILMYTSCIKSALAKVYNTQ